MSLEGRESLFCAQPPADPCVTTARMKEHLRVSHSEEDTLIAALVSRAEGWVEQRSGRSLMYQCWRYRTWNGYRWDGTRLALPRAAPFRSLDLVMVRREIETADLVVASDLYHVDGEGEPAIVTALSGFPAGVVHTFEYFAGSADAEDVDPQLVQAVTLLAAHWYENREASVTGTISKEIEFAATSLVEPFRLEWRL